MPIARLAAVVLLLSVVPADVAGAQAVTVRRDIQYAEQDGVPLLLDAWLPAGPGPHVAVVAVHGGRFRNEKVGKEATPAGSLAESGFAVFSVDYRLAPEHPFPAALEDVQAAVIWIREHAQEFDVDPDLIWAIGASAGGNLVAMLATVGQGPLDQGSRVAAAVSLSGPMDLVTWLESGSGDPVVTDYLGCEPQDSGCLERARQASPITYVDPTDPPMVVANGTEEIIPLYHAVEMAEALEQAGVPHRLIEVPGDQHAWALGRDPFAQALSFVVGELDLDGISPVGPPTVPEVSAQPTPEREVSGDRVGRRSGSPLLFPLGLGVIVLAAAAGAWAWVRRRPRGAYR